MRKGRLDEVRPLPRSRIYELDEANRSFGEMIEGLRERNLIRETLGQFVPEQVAHELLAGGGKLEPEEGDGADVRHRGFAALTDSLGAHRTIEFLNAYFEVVVEIVERYQRRRHPVPGRRDPRGVQRADRRPRPRRQRAARRARNRARRQEQSFAGVRARNRVGLSTGRVVAGAVGSAGGSPTPCTATRSTWRRASSR